MQHICVVFGNPLLASTNIKQCRDQLPFSGDVKAERHSGHRRPECRFLAHFSARCFLNRLDCLLHRPGESTQSKLRACRVDVAQPVEQRVHLAVVNHGEQRPVERWPRMAAEVGLSAALSSPDERRPSGESFDVEFAHRCQHVVFVRLVVCYKYCFHCLISLTFSTLFCVHA